MSRMSGADADALDHAGIRLERAGVDLRNRRARLQRSINSSPWNGRSADRFRSEFNSTHARAMERAAGFLDAAFEELLRHADQQRAASGARGRSLWDRIRLGFRRLPTWISRLPWFNWPDIRPPRPWWPFPAIPRFPWNPGDWFRPRWPVVPLPDIRPIDPGDWVDDIVIGIGIGSLAPIIGLLPRLFPPAGREQSGRAGSGAADAMPNPARPGPSSPPTVDVPGATTGTLRGEIGVGAAQKIHDTYRPGLSPEYRYQCVAWAQARWKEMHEAAHPGTGWQPAAGNGWELAGNNGGTASTPPTLGAMASYGDGTHGNFGHVMIIEEIAKPAEGHMRIRVSEMNIDANPDIGTPSEYSDSRWWSKQPDGSWLRESDTKRVSMTFATFPG